MFPIIISHLDSFTMWMTNVSVSKQISLIDKALQAYPLEGVSHETVCWDWIHIILIWLSLSFCCLIYALFWTRRESGWLQAVGIVTVTYFINRFYFGMNHTQLVADTRNLMVYMIQNDVIRPLWLPLAKPACLWNMICLIFHLSACLCMTTLICYYKSKV